MRGYGTGQTATGKVIQGFHSDGTIYYFIGEIYRADQIGSDAFLKRHRESLNAISLPIVIVRCWQSILTVN